MASHNRTERIEARTTPETLAVVKQAAEMQGRSLSEFVVSAAEAAARDAIEETQIIRLSAADQKAFIESLITPPEPAPAMVRAIELHKQLIGNE